MTPQKPVKERRRPSPITPKSIPDPVLPVVDVRAQAIKAKALADAKKKAAEAVKAEAERLKHEHEATQAEADRLASEHLAHNVEAQRLADEAEAQETAARAALPWHRRLFS